MYKKFKTLKSCFNTFHPIRSFFSHMQLHYFSFHNFFLIHILRIKKDEFSVPCFVFNFTSRKNKQIKILFDRKFLIQNQLRK